ncbi:RibD family protein [Aetokthonos hydrillicola Thurmond2011]|jgi:5-amino-6-(5-phosphoribosylamino)uracil reductase|uniref:RibD family protein n=1 Tax=Aetokthonos hydrillicola Thurmond2011 TaxID=2712845 RepID=A0AAP5IE94_9CYAN|nr:RibD family protein [Aetokthonos hydrillicola]MBO3458054.1 RibD family protein [Aetokthonos hydrillicola CCALA 1050]MBW4587111.1 RibD family protein [Aetokthonos hydrillicola CCALA 1050]MDR9899639.1 RibD family protein [Aetokthonos hydrillicola Thurmond2011]
MTNIQTTLVLGMTADGKITPVDQKAPRISFPADSLHLQYQASLADLFLIGAQTIRMEGVTFILDNPELSAARKVRDQSAQPITCVISRSLNIPANLPFFTQEVERWIFTTRASLEQSSNTAILSKQAELIDVGETDIDWEKAYNFMAKRGIRKVVALGGGSLTASLMDAGRIDDWWLSIWPAIYGGKQAPTPVEGEGFLPKNAPLLELIETRQVGNEFFLHYRILKELPDGVKKKFYSPS